MSDVMNECRSVDYVIKYVDEMGKTHTVKDIIVCMNSKVWRFYDRLGKSSSEAAILAQDEFLAQRAPWDKP